MTSKDQVMPIPGTDGAPRFNGHYLDEFLEDLEAHFARAKIDDEDKQVNFISRYCVSAVRDRIRNLPDFSRTKTNKTWEKAKRRLTEFYGDVDRPQPLSLAEFHARVQAMAERPPFVSKNQVNVYYSDYMTIAQPMLDANIISENDLNFTFVQGVPTTMKSNLRMLIPEGRRLRSDAYPIDDMLKILQGLANREESTYDSWKHPDTSSDARAFLSAPPAMTTQNARLQNIPAASGDTSAKSSLSMEEQMQLITKQMADLQLMVARVIPNADTTNTRPTPNLDRRCHMCGASGHGLRRCPETEKLISEGRVRYDVDKQRIVMAADGSELPRAPTGFIGNWATYIRAQTPTPPTTRAAATLHAGLVFEDGSSFSSLNMSFVSDPALRDGKQYENHFDPKKRPNAKPSARQRTQSDVQAPSQPAPLPTHVPPQQSPPMQTPPSQAPQTPPQPSSSQQPQPVPRTTAQPSVPPPPHPINRQDGWKQSQPKGKGKEVQFEGNKDVHMGDETSQWKAKSNIPSVGYKHTTDLETGTKPSEVFKKLLKQTNITLPLEDVLGVSSSLQELMHDATRRRRVPKDGTTQTGHAVAQFDSHGIPIVQAEYSTASSFRGQSLYNDDYDSDNQDTAFASFALTHARGFPALADRMFAMATGIFTARVNRIPFRFMVDSGSELNVANRNFPAAAKLPLDFRGQRWSLKGIHGGPEPLRGYLDKVPIEIGGHTFEHHVFVSPNESVGENFDIILGQPFLTFFDARVDYSSSGETVLFLWSQRDKEDGSPPTLGISITDPEDVRNRLHVLSHSHSITPLSYVSPYVTEVPDGDCGASASTSACIVELSDDDAVSQPPSFC